MKDLIKLEQNHERKNIYNLSKKQAITLRELATLKRADKGGAVVIQKSNKYIEETESY